MAQDVQQLENELAVLQNNLKEFDAAAAAGDKAKLKELGVDFEVGDTVQEIRGQLVSKINAKKAEIEEAKTPKPQQEQQKSEEKSEEKPPELSPAEKKAAEIKKYDNAISKAKTPEEKAKLAIEKSRKHGILQVLENRQKQLSGMVIGCKNEFGDPLSPAKCDNIDLMDQPLSGWSMPFPMPSDTFWSDVGLPHFPKAPNIPPANVNMTKWIADAGLINLNGENVSLPPGLDLSPVDMRVRITNFIYWYLKMMDTGIECLKKMQNLDDPRPGAGWDGEYSLSFAEKACIYNYKTGKIILNGPMFFGVASEGWAGNDKDQDQRWCLDNLLNYFCWSAKSGGWGQNRTKDVSWYESNPPYEVLRDQVQPTDNDYTMFRNDSTQFSSKLTPKWKEFEQEWMYNEPEITLQDIFYKDFPKTRHTYDPNIGRKYVSSKKISV